MCFAEFGAKYTVIYKDENQDSLPLMSDNTSEEYRMMMRQLNKKQLHIVKFHRNWCMKTVIALRNGYLIVPYRVFLSGPGGVGKSHVIKLIQSDTIKLLGLSGQIEPGQVTVLLTTPTGVAAFNIGGMTLHTALLLGYNKFQGYKPLPADKLNTLRSRLCSLQLLIIEEVSMVGSNMLLEIHKRLQEIKEHHLTQPLEELVYWLLETSTNYHLYVNLHYSIWYLMCMQDSIRADHCGEMNLLLELDETEG